MQEQQVLRKNWLNEPAEQYWIKKLQLEDKQTPLSNLSIKEKDVLSVIEIGELLKKAGLVSKERMLELLAEYFSLPILSTLTADMCQVELIQKIPIHFFKQHQLLPVAKLADGRIQVAIVNPGSLYTLVELSQLLKADVVPYLCRSEDLLEVTNKVFAQKQVEASLENDESTQDEEETDENVDLVDLNDEAPIIRWVNSVIFHAVRQSASDIHLEPREKDLMVRYRIDGVLQEAKQAPRQFVGAIAARIKIMAGLNIAEKRLPQDGRIRRKITGKEIDMRVATAPTGFGERITIRLLDKSSLKLDLGQMGFASDQLSLIHDLITRPHGIFLVTGPTGSGKTTTLYAGLSKINTPDINIMTVEDPVEYQLDGISQVQVNPKIELTFASAIRSFLRHDPDVIMVGEIRDQETASMAVTASLTGHLVFSTIHTNDSAGAINRLIDMGIEPFLVVSSLSGVLAQRLVRKLCIHCRQMYHPTPEEIEQLGLSKEDFFSGQLEIPEYTFSSVRPDKKMLFRADKKGCAACNQTGYLGRTAIYELMVIHEAIRSLALKKSDSVSMKKIALQQGMRTLRKDGAYKVVLGVTSVEEVMLMTAEEQS